MEFVHEETEGESDLYRIANPINESIPEFSAVTGICRTCTHSFIYEREYGGEVKVVCDAIHPPMTMHLDIQKCSRYSRRGEMSLSSMNEIGLPIDPRKSTGQYL